MPTGPSGTVNAAEAVPVLEATMFLATARDDPGAFRKRSALQYFCSLRRRCLTEYAGGYVCMAYHVRF